MDSRSWITRLSTSSPSSSAARRYSRSDLYWGGGGFDDAGPDDALKAEFLCPFCAEEFDVVGLCCHIDEDHPLEAKNGVCPVCAKRVGMDLVSHLTMQHGSFLKVQPRRRLRKGGLNSTFCALRKELREGNLQALLGGGSSYVVSSSAAVDSDALLSSFMCCVPPVSEPAGRKPSAMVQSGNGKGVAETSIEDRNTQEISLSIKDQAEKAQRSEFVRELLLSTILGDGA